MEHKITIMKYQTMFPGMTKKLFDEKERFYQIAVISIRLDELQTKGAVLQKMGKPTKSGTRMTFAPVRSAGEYEAEMQRILDKASSSRDIVSRVQNEITNAKKKENAKKLKAKLKKMGVEKAPEQYSQQMYNGKWKTVIEFNLADDVPDEINLPEQKGQMYWYEMWRDLRIVTKAPKEKKKPTKEELAKKEQERKSKEIKEILKGSATRRKEFIAGIISGKIPALKDENAAREKIWDALVLIGYGLYGSVARGFFLEGDEWKYSEEERKQANETFKGLSITHQMLVFLHGSMITVGETYDYSGRYAKEKADKLLKGYEALELFGWFFEMDEEKQVLDGTSELFAPAEEK